MNFARSLFTVSGLTVVSRVGGFVRDTLTAMFLGAGPIADAYVVAQRLPNLFRSLFAEGAFAAAFVPLYTTEKNKNGAKAALVFAGRALAVLCVVLVPFSIAMIAFMPFVMDLIAPGFRDDPQKFELAVTFSRITFPYLLLISLTALQGGVLNAENRFGPAAAAPISYNIVLVAAILLAKPLGLDLGLTLAWSITLAGIVQACWLFISCRRAGVTIPLLTPAFDPSTRRLFRHVGPGAVGAGAAQINLLISTILASTMETGAVSWLFYADRLNQLPLGIVGVAVASTLLPLLSRHVDEKQDDHVRHYTSRAIEFCLLLGLPATLGLMLAGYPIVITLFQHGAFTHDDSLRTAHALAAYALGIPGFFIVKVFSTRFFARHDTKTPVRIAMASMAINVLVALALFGPLHHVGIAMANSVATWSNALLLYIALRKRKEVIGDAKLKQRLPRIFIAAAGLGLTTAALAHVLAPWFTERGLLLHTTALAIIIGGASLVYLILLHVTGAFRLREGLAALRRKHDLGPDTTEPS